MKLFRGSGQRGEGKKPGGVACVSNSLRYVFSAHCPQLIDIITGQDIYGIKTWLYISIKDKNSGSNVLCLGPVDGDFSSALGKFVYCLHF